jgi:serine/threonine protein kinase
MASKTKLKVGTVVGGYTLTKLLGSGRQAQVFIASHPAYRGRLVLKVLYPAPAAIIERELRVLQTLPPPGHEHVVALRDFVWADDRLCLVFDHQEGLVLPDYLARYRPTPRVFLELMGQVASGLAYLDDHDIVHADLHYNNVYVRLYLLADPIMADALVLDLGYAHTRDNRGGFGQAYGMPMFMAPEAFRDDFSQITPAYDVYALGVMIYWGISGQMPFATDDQQALVAAKLVLAQPDVSAIGHPALAVLLAQMMAKDPGERPWASEVRGRLARLLRDWE